MANDTSWRYDEFQQVGKDYSQSDEVDVYDSTHSDFREPEKEAEAILNALSVTTDDVLIDFGAGTGTLAIRAAQRGATVYAVDVSEAMLTCARSKADSAGVSDIIFCHGGFLTYEHAGRKADAISTSFSLHHLPDFWKGIALVNLSRMLTLGGLLYIHDVIIEDGPSLDNIEAFIEKQAVAGGDFLRDDAEQHFREEYSTYDWVLEGLLARTGFDIRHKAMQDGVIGTYVCAKATTSAQP